MNLDSLREIYRKDQRVKRLAEVISSDKAAKIQVKTLMGSSVSMLAAALRDHMSHNHLFIAEDAEQAAYLHNDLEKITGALDISYFPDSLQKSARGPEINTSHVMLRTEALKKWAVSGIRKKVLVSFPEALIEKVVSPEIYQDISIALRLGKTVEMASITDALQKQGFLKSDFVYEPGQYALRGGILDIYSFGNEHPYRIEWLGKQIESIRIFDPGSQLSVRKLSAVSILPHVDYQAEGAEKIPLFSFLPPDTVVWVHDYRYCLEQMEKHYQEMESFGESIDEPREGDPEIKRWSRDDFHPAELWKPFLADSILVEWAGNSLSQQPAFAKVETLEADLSPQPVFVRQYQLLLDDLNTRTQAGYKPYILAENPRQLERLRTIFEDQGGTFSFTPVQVPLSQGFIDHDLKLLCYTDHQIFQRYHKYRIRKTHKKERYLTLRALRDLQPGDYVTHVDHGVGIFSGLQKLEVNGNMQEAIRILYRDNDVLYVNINSLHKISKYSGKEGTVPRVHKIGSDAWEKLKNKTKKQVKDIAADLIRLYALRKASKGFAHSPDTYLQAELEASFLYEDTPDQSRATAEVKKDMESPYPMDRLICGDVGFGKTEIGIRAAFKTVADSKQAAVLVPTTILAFQHFQTFSERLKDFPCTVDYISRFKSSKEKKETLQKLEKGEIDIIIGTHALLGKGVKFKDLGLLIIDEEQKFGVAAKEKLRAMSAQVDTLTLTATPIPRTLQFSLMNARDLSIMHTPPPNRQPVHTEIVHFDEEMIREAIYYEVERGGQVYFVHNRVKTLPEMAALLRRLCPDIEIGMAHGQMDGKELEETLFGFIDRQFDLLCCTNIVESGVDIPNANTIIIHNAHQFGLSDLHQLRGRVGRSNQKAFCYLVSPPLTLLASDSRKRLQTLEQFSELGSGFQIAMRDLDIRGAGNLLGGEQSGFIAEIGFDMYQKILNEAINELKTTEFKELFQEEASRKESHFVTECTMDTDLELLIPDAYIENSAERLSVYTQMDHLKEDAEIENYGRGLEDRFGPLPKQVKELMAALSCRRMAAEAGFEKLILKSQKLRLYFISDPDSPYFESSQFDQILDYIQTRHNKARLKQVGKKFYLIIDRIRSMEEARNFLESLPRPAKT